MMVPSSVPGFAGLWLLGSFLLWAGYRVIKRRDFSRQRSLIVEAQAYVVESGRTFDGLRARSRHAPQIIPPGQTAGEPLHADVRALLNSIEAQSPFFDRGILLRKRIQQSFHLKDFAPIAEVLQLRRDLWAAAEVFLMDDMRGLGQEFEDNAAYATFRAEAESLLFKDPAAQAAYNDPVALRLGVAHSEATEFLATLDETVAVDRKKHGLRRVGDVIVLPWRAAIAINRLAGDLGYRLGDLVTSAQSVARAMSLRGLAGAVAELRQARAEMPVRFAAAFEKAGGLAHKGNEGLKRHYEFILEAQELRARYAEVLARAPKVTDAGRQFLARLELEKRAEDLKETSEGVLAWARLRLVIGIAYIIAGLQRIQAIITPAQNKQLAPRPVVSDRSAVPEASFQAAAPSREPLRVLLPSALAPRHQGHRRDNRTARAPLAKGGTYTGTSLGKAEEVTATPKNTLFHLRDRVTAEPGPAAIRDRHRLEPEVANTRPDRPRLPYAEGMGKVPFKDLLKEVGDTEDTGGVATSDVQGGDKPSLRDRLAAVAADTTPPGSTAPAPLSQPARKNASRSKRFGFLKSRAR